LRNTFSGKSNFPGHRSVKAGNGCPVRAAERTSPIADLTPEIACEALRAAGLSCSPDEIQLVAREKRWAVMLPGERLAWFPASQSASRRLAVERRVLRLLAECCSFRVPRTLLVSESGFEVRQMVPGRCDPWGLFERCKRDSELAQRIAQSLGAILAEQHTAIGEAEVTGWLPWRVAWPERRDWIRERLPCVVDDDDLRVIMGRTIERYEAVAVDAGDRVLVHGDLGLHNLALDPQTDTVNGIFDYDGAAWADRHHDFRYLLFDVGREDMLDAALAVYEPAIGRTLDRDRIRLYNAACAITFLAFRSGTPPDQKSCGRTLAEDLCWVRTALAKLP
jgi:aminoglycoside phosphotransferase (APT) family kinase protein